MSEAEPVRYELVGYGAEVVPLYDRSDEAAYLRTQVQLLTDEVKRLRLTDDEQETIKAVIRREVSAHWGTARNLAGPLQGILNRIGGTQ